MLQKNNLKKYIVEFLYALLLLLFYSTYNSKANENIELHIVVVDQIKKNRWFEDIIKMLGTKFCCW